MQIQNKLTGFKIKLKNSHCWQLTQRPRSVSLACSCSIRSQTNTCMLSCSHMQHNEQETVIMFIATPKLLRNIINDATCRQNNKLIKNQCVNQVLRGTRCNQSTFHLIDELQMNSSESLKKKKRIHVLCCYYEESDSESLSVSAYWVVW